MDRAGIRQWNVTGYLDAYPMDYYRAQQALGNLYVFEKNVPLYWCGRAAASE